MLYGSGFQCKGRDFQRQCSLCGAQMRSAKMALRIVRENEISLHKVFCWHYQQNSFVVKYHSRALATVQI